MAAAKTLRLTAATTADRDVVVLRLEAEARAQTMTVCIEMDGPLGVALTASEETLAALARVSRGT